MIRRILGLVVLALALLAACDGAHCVDWQGNDVLCGAQPSRPVRYCVDAGGHVLDESRCWGATMPLGYQWAYYNHYYTPGQVVVLHDSIQPTYGYVTHGAAIKSPALRPVYRPTAPDSPRVSNAPIRVDPPKAGVSTPRPSLFAPSGPKVSSVPIRTSPVQVSPRISSAPIRVAPSPVRVSAPRISSVRAR